MGTRERIKTGVFYTPLDYVSVAHRYLDTSIDPAWNKTCCVWDASCGTGNLTQARDIPLLFQSTLEPSDVAFIQSRPQGNVCIQHDFLSSLLLPAEFPSATETGSLLFLNNPPYKTPTEYRPVSGERYPDAARTEVGVAMGKLGLKKAAQDLDKQFMWKLTHLVPALKTIGYSSFYMAIFTPLNHWTQPSSTKLLVDSFCKNWRFCAGFAFDKSEFENTRGGGSNWAVAFTVWKYESTTESCQPPQYIPIALYARNHSGVPTEIDTIQVKLASENSPSFTDWGRQLSVATGPLVYRPPLTSVSIVKGKLSATEIDQLPASAIGFLNIGGNGLDKAAQQTNIFSSAYANSHGWAISSDAAAVKIASTVFSVRHSWKRMVSWKTAHIMLEPPNVDMASEFEELQNICLIYALFSDNSLQSSIGPSTWTKKGESRKGECRNGFFFCSIHEMKSWCPNSFSALRNDIESATESTVAKIIATESDNLCAHEKLLIDRAKAVIRYSMPLREQCASKDPALSRFDAGWKQLYSKNTTLWKAADATLQSMIDEINQFVVTTVASRIRTLSMKLGIVHMSTIPISQITDIESAHDYAIPWDSQMILAPQHQKRKIDTDDPNCDVICSSSSRQKQESETP